MAQHSCSLSQSSLGRCSPYTGQCTPLFQLQRYSSQQRGCSLTPRSSGAPTAGHQARSGGTRYAVRGTFSPARAWRPAVAARLARTLGIRRTAVCRSRRKCACRRELNSHDAAKPQISFGSGRWLEAASPMDGTDQIEQPDFSQGRRERRPVQTRDDTAIGGEMGSAASLRQPCQRSDEWKTGQLKTSVPSFCKESRPRTRGCGPRCKAPSAMQGSWRTPQTRGTATALAVARGGEQNGPHANTAFPACRTH